MKERLGITLIVPAGHEATGIYESADGIDAFLTDEPYLTSDGAQLQPPLPVFDAGGPMFRDSTGGMQTALAVLTIPTDIPEAWLMDYEFIVMDDDATVVDVG